MLVKLLSFQALAMAMQTPSGQVQTHRVTLAKPISRTKSDDSVDERASFNITPIEANRLASSAGVPLALLPLVAANAQIDITIEKKGSTWTNKKTAETGVREADAIIFNSITLAPATQEKLMTAAIQATFSGGFANPVVNTTVVEPTPTDKPAEDDLGGN